MNVKTFTTPTKNVKPLADPAINVSRQKYLIHLKNIWDGDSASNVEIL